MTGGKLPFVGVCQSMATNKKLEQQKARRAKYVQGWRDLGIHDSIISRYDLRNKNPDKIRQGVFDEIKKESRTAKIRETKARKAQERLDYLTGQGFKKSEIKKSWLQSDKLLYEALGKTNPKEVFKAKSHLALSFTTVNGADIFEGTSKYKNLSFDEIKERIQNRVDDAEKNPGGSDELVCVFQFFSGSESECEEVQNVFAQRGYNLKANKLTDKRYHRLMNRNDWTMREYAELTLAIISQCHNRDVPMYITQLRDFAEENDLPFDEIFN